MILPVPDKIEVLDKHHARRSFACGNSELDDYLQRFARQHSQNRVSRTYVAVRDTTILGYYSLAMSAIRIENLPEKHHSKFPHYPLPVARLARLAVDQKFQKKGLGSLLLADALMRCLTLSAEIGMIGVVVDAKDLRAKQWYERFEFEQLSDSSLKLWISLPSLKSMVSSVSTVP
jgi:GNAT superfamily N-acetyltransferase